MTESYLSAIAEFAVQKPPGATVHIRYEPWMRGAHELLTTFVVAVLQRQAIGVPPSVAKEGFLLLGRHIVPVGGMHVTL